MWESALGRFRIIAILEGISLLVLFFVAMPLKYVAGYPAMTQWVGWVHGVLFLAYLGFGALAAHREQWNLKICAIAVFVSLIPFGTFWFDRWITRQPARSI